MEGRVKMIHYKPHDSGDLFERVDYPDPATGLILNPGEVECKACATTLDTPMQADLQAHANKPQKLSDGSVGTCAEFWADWMP